MVGNSSDNLHDSGLLLNAVLKRLPLLCNLKGPDLYIDQDSLSTLKDSVIFLSTSRKIPGK